MSFRPHCPAFFCIRIYHHSPVSSPFRDFSPYPLLASTSSSLDSSFPILSASLFGSRHLTNPFFLSLSYLLLPRLVHDVLSCRPKTLAHISMRQRLERRFAMSISAVVIHAIPFHCRKHTLRDTLISVQDDIRKCLERRVQKK